MQGGGTHPTGMLSCLIIFTTRKGSLRRLFFTGVCLSTGGGLPQCMLGYTPLPGRPPCQGDSLPRRPPLPGRPPSPLPRRPPTPPARETPRPTPRGEIEGDQVQAPQPRGKLRGIRSRPTPKGEIQGDQIQAHTQGGNSGGSDAGPH